MSNNEEDRREGSDGGSDGDQSRRDSKRDERRPWEGVIGSDRAREGDDERREGRTDNERREGRTSDERRENEKSERGRAPERRAGRGADRRRGGDRDGDDRHRRSDQGGRRSRRPGEPTGSASRSHEVPGLRDRRPGDRGGSGQSRREDAERRVLAVRLGRPARSVRNRERRRLTLPRDGDQTSAEREYPPWLDVPDEDGKTDSQGDEREVWEAPLERAGPDTPAEGPGSRHRQPRVQPERLVTRQPPDPRLGPPPRPGDGQPRQRSRGGEQAQDGQPVDQPGGRQNRPQQGPGLDPRYQIGEWVRTVQLPPQAELPPRLRSQSARTESTDSPDGKRTRDGNRRYLEPQEVNPNRRTGLGHEQWEYSESRPDRPSERWETPDSDHEPGNDDRERNSDRPKVEPSDIAVRRLRGPDDRDDQRRRDRRRRWRESTN